VAFRNAYSGGIVFDLDLAYVIIYKTNNKGGKNRDEKNS
jgi:hypothetical protein